MLLDAFALLPLRLPAPPAAKRKSERRQRQREKQAQAAASSSSHAAGTGNRHGDTSGDRHGDTQEEREDEAAPIEEERLATQRGGASSPKRAKSSEQCRHASFSISRLLSSISPSSIASKRLDAAAASFLRCRSRCICLLADFFLTALGASNLSGRSANASKSMALGIYLTHAREILSLSNVCRRTDRI